MSDNMMPERISAYINGNGLGCFELHPNIPLTTEYIRADVAAARIAAAEDAATQAIRVAVDLQGQLDAANKRIAELETAQAWVSVDERLPDVDEVLVYGKDEWGYDEWEIDSYSLMQRCWLNDATPTHWMPLPPPPVTDVTP